MNVRLIALTIPFFLAAVLPAAEPTAKDSISERIAGRTYPSVFQAWNPAENLKNEDRWTTLARHDLAFHAPDFFDLKWSDEFPGLATTFTNASQESAMRTRKLLHGKNPNLVLLAELRYRDAHRSYLPENHA